MVVPYMLTLLADARRRAGRVDEALLTLDEALAVAAGNGERWCEAETLRLRGELLLEVSDERSAEQALRQALALARAQEARALERRAAVVSPGSEEHAEHPARTTLAEPAVRLAGVASLYATDTRMIPGESRRYGGESYQRLECGLPEPTRSRRPISVGLHRPVGGPAGVEGT